MRVISQDGNFDLPYENLAIFVEYENVIARFENERHLLAQYSSEEKAIKAMEMLKETHPKFYNLLHILKNNGVTYAEAIDWINEHGNMNIKY